MLILLDLLVNYLIGLAGNLIGLVFFELAPPPTEPSLPGLVAQVGFTFGGPALCFCYVIAITLLFEDGAWRRRLGRLGAVGRMALTNYLMQSVVCTLLFNGYTEQVAHMYKGMDLIKNH